MEEPDTVELLPGEQAALVATATALSAGVAVAVDGCLEGVQAVITARAIRLAAGSPESESESEYARGARMAFLLAVKAIETCRLAATQGVDQPPPPP